MMADIRSYSYPSKGTKQRTASSHIPLPVSRLKKEDMNHRHLSAPEPSRLVLMQNRYQQQLLHEKETKLIKMYEDNQDSALGRVGVSGSGSGTNRGIVRDFFRERREIEQSTSAPSLNRTEHFQQKKLRNRGELLRREEEKERQLHQLRRATSERQVLPQQQQQQQQGFNRSNPLVPLGNGRSQSMKNMHRPPSPGGVHDMADRPGHSKHDEPGREQFQPRQPLGSQAETKRSGLPQRINRPPLSSTQPKKIQPAAFQEDEDEPPVPALQPPTRKQIRKPKTKPRAKPEWVATAELTHSDSEDDTGQSLPQQRKPQVQPKRKKESKSKTKPEPVWKPPATYSDEDDHATSPNFPKVGQLKRKTDHGSNKKQSGNTQNAPKNDFQNWQLEQDNERANRLERYQNKLESKHQPEIDYRFDNDMKEQKAKQQQRRKEYDEMEEQQRYMKELESKISRKQSELAQLDSDLEPDTPHQPHPNPASNAAKPSQQTTERYSKQESFSPRGLDSDLSYNSNTPSDDTSLADARKRIVTKPAKVQSKSKPKPKLKQQPKLQDSAPSPSPDDYTLQPSTANFYAEVAETDEAAGVDIDLRACPICGRRFAVDRLAKHAKVCKKTAQKKPRKVFDTRQQRIEGTDLEGYADDRHHKRDERPKKSSNWREKHNEFISAIQDARKVQSHLAKGGSLRDLPPPAPAQHSDYRQCPHCQRRFDPAVAERHIPKCRESRSRPHPPPKKTGRR